MTASIDDATSGLVVLQAALESGEWKLSAPERTCASSIVRATGSPTEAILEGFELSGPEVAPPGGKFAPALMRCAIALRPASVATSEAGQQLRELLGTVLYAALAVPIHGGDRPELG